MLPKLERTKEGWSLRLRFGNGRRGRFLLPLDSRAAAERRAQALASLAVTLAAAERHAEAAIILRKGAAQTTAAGFAEVEQYARDLCAESKAAKQAGPAAMTFRQLGEAWRTGELHRKHPDHVKVKRSVADDGYRLAKLYDIVGDVPLSVFSVDDAERAMASLPDGRRPATRRHYGQLIARVLKMAVYPCRLIERSPIPAGFLPKSGARPAFGFLYPSEDAALLACEDVPLGLRLLYGFLAREGLRLSEALGLTWRDFDLVRGVVTLDKNKTDTPRSWALTDGVTEALAASRGGAQDAARVFPLVDTSKAATRFREHLKLAKVERAELHERSDVRRPIRVHDLRATFITLALASDRTETWVQDRTGHTTSQMLNKYRRQARFASELGLGTLVPLAEAVKVGREVGQSGVASNGGDSESAMKTTTSDSGSRGTRTLDLRIKSPQLYRLSYRPGGRAHYWKRSLETTVVGGRGALGEAVSAPEMGGVGSSAARWPEASGPHCLASQLGPLRRCRFA